MTEHNIFQEIQEDLERQKWVDLWKRYGILIIAAAVAIVIGTAGITSWYSYRVQQNQKATAGLMATFKASAGDEAKQIDALEAYAKNNNATTQAAFAQLQAGALLAKDGKTDQAIQTYDTVAKDQAVDPAFRQLGDLMSVRAQLDTAAPADLQKRLEPLTADKAPWRLTALEYTGYVALRAGDKAKAKQIFTDLSQNAAAPQSLSARAADMLRYVSE